MTTFVQDLKQRKVVQWAIAYVAGSWLILEILGFVAENFGWPTSLVRGVTVLFGVGFFVALVLAWYHGEKGRQRATGWELFIITCLLLVAGVATAYVGRGAESRQAATGYSAVPAIDPHSIAVLPFVSRSEAGESAAVVFSEGMHDDVLTQLAKVGRLKVISRTSVMKYRETEKSIPEIAAELGVATVLEGVVQRAGNRVRVNVQLIDAQSDEHLWAETYDEELTAANIFAIQTDLAKKIAGALKATLTPDVEARIEARPTESLEAFDLYTRGRYIMEGPRGFSKEGLEEARELFQGAIREDASYAPAWAALARVYLIQWSQAHRPAEEALPTAWSAVNRALALDPELSDAPSARGALLRAELKFEEAEAAYLRALALNPGSAEEHRRYSLLLNDLGRYDEAAQEARRAVELDPLSTLNREGLAAALLFARDWDGVVEESWKLIELEPRDPIAYYNAGYGHSMRGEHEEAIAALQKARELDPGDTYNTAGLAWAYARAGDRDEALALLAKVPEQGAMLKEIAIVYAQLGELDLAFEYLERVAAEDPGMLGELRVDPTADVLRTDPRYAAVLERFGLQ
ncbi:MAG: tetratricopeptide repeat protein [Gemmatimonadales bacterium]